MNAEGGRASGIGSAGHGGWWEGGGEWVTCLRWMGNRITKSNYKLLRTYTVIAEKTQLRKRSVTVISKTEMRNDSIILPRCLKKDDAPGVDYENQVSG